MRIIIMSLFVLSSLLCTAQNMQFASVSKESRTITSQLIPIEGKTFNGGTTAKGQLFINRTSKSGKDYKQYLGYPTKETFNGQSVYTCKDQLKYWTLSLGRTGFPKRNYLEVVQ